MHKTTLLLIFLYYLFQDVKHDIPSVGIEDKSDSEISFKNIENNNEDTDLRSRHKKRKD